MDLFRIQGLQVDAIIGIHDHERRNRQPLLLDLEYVTDIRRAARGDAISYTLDYSKISDYAANFVAASSFHLIEALAEELARRLMRDFSLPWLRLCVSKPEALPAAENVCLIIERGELP